MTEQQIQKKISDHLTKQGYYVIKLIKTNKNGIPDLLAIHSQSETILIEVKKPDGVTSKLQDFRLKELKQEGIRCFVAYGYEDYLNKV